MPDKRPEPNRPELEWSDEARRDAALLRALEATHATPWPSDCPLAPYELRVLEATSHGLTDREVAVVLGISHETVRKYQKGIQRKLAAKNRAHAMAKALRQGIIR